MTPSTADSECDRRSRVSARRKASSSAGDVSLRYAGVHVALAAHRSRVVEARRGRVDGGHDPPRGVRGRSRRPELLARADPDVGPTRGDADRPLRAVSDRERRFYNRTVIPWADGLGIVEFPDGRRIRGRGLRQPLPDGPHPEFAVYLLARDPGPFDWPHRWVRWPDFRTPASTPDAISTLQDAYQRSVTERVEIACAGGVGRTGTALALLAVLAGVPRAEAVGWVRRRYNKRAAETPWQRRWVLKVEGVR
jgi:hypothetical protein